MTFGEKYPQKFAGKCPQTYPEPRARLRLILNLNLNLNLDISRYLDLDLNLSLFLFLKSFHEKFQKSSGLSFGLLFD